MYIQKAEIKNIRSIIDFEIEFKNPAGWHVLIGDNGAGKSTIIRSIALALVGDIQAQGLRANWDDWLNKKANNLIIKLEIHYILGPIEFKDIEDAEILLAIKNSHIQTVNFEFSYTRNADKHLFGIAFVRLEDKDDYGLYSNSINLDFGGNPS